MLSNLYRSVMDPQVNPLRVLPAMVRYQLMTILAYMWSVVFALWIGSAFAFGISVVGHTALLVGLFFTTSVFGFAEASMKPETSDSCDPTWRGQDLPAAATSH